MDYWQECISEAFDDAGITATQKQIAIVASWAEGARENESLARGWDCIPNPVSLENEQLKKELAEERDKQICEECHGEGSTTTYGPIHSAISQCTNCHGEGRY